MQEALPEPFRAARILRHPRRLATFARPWGSAFFNSIVDNKSVDNGLDDEAIELSGLPKIPGCIAAPVGAGQTCGGQAKPDPPRQEGGKGRSAHLNHADGRESGVKTAASQFRLIATAAGQDWILMLPKPRRAARPSPCRVLASPWNPSERPRWRSQGRRSSSLHRRRRLRARSSAGWSAPATTVFRFRLPGTQSPLGGHPAQSPWFRRGSGARP